MGQIDLDGMIVFDQFAAGNCALKDILPVEGDLGRGAAELPFVQLSRGIELHYEHLLPVVYVRDVEYGGLCFGVGEIVLVYEG